MNKPLTEEQLTQLANKSASLAVKKTFAILGVDVEEPKDLENFRRDLRFSSDLRRYAGHGILAFIGAVFVAGAAMIWKNLTGA
jgi:hypothetical protein